jgi:hypothetical protein
MQAPTELSPFAHELNTEGTTCAVDCPACRWVEERSPESDVDYETRLRG